MGKTKLCDYSDIFGEPNEGIHQYRLPIGSNGFSIAIVDLLFTIAAAFVIQYFLPTKGIMRILSFFFVFIILLSLGIYIHKVMCVNTALNNLIFSD